MKPNPSPTRPTFYRRLWRFNAFVIAGVGIALIVLAGFVVATFINDNRRHASDLSDFAAMDEAAAGAAPFPGLLDLKQLAGSPWLAVTVAAGDATDQRNVLLVDQRSGASRHVLPDNGRHLVQWHVVPDERSGAAARAYVALVDTVAPAGSGAAGLDILVGNLATGRQAWVARGVTAMEQPHLVGEDSIGMLVWQGDRLDYRRYSLSTLTEELARPVPLMPVEQRRREQRAPRL